MPLPEAPQEIPPVPPDGSTLGESVTRLEHDGREILVVGTAHVSRKSVLEVKGLIEELRPDAVCVELDAARYETLMDESRWRRLDARAVLREGRASLMLASLLFSGFQKRIGDKLGVLPGSEMLAAVEAARAVGAQVVLADRDIQTTLRRCYASLGALDRVKVFAGLAFLPFAAAEIDEADVERLKSREAIGDAMTVFAEQMPALKVPLIDERDRYLIARTRETPGKRVVSVVGAAHVAGMVKALGAPIDREALMGEVPESALVGLRAWVLPALLAAAVWRALGTGSTDGVVTVLGRVALGAGLGSLAAVIAAGGGVATALAALTVAPLSVALPPFPLARIAGEVQARTRPPSPDDGASIRADMLTPSRLRKNRFIVVLLVTVAANLGRTLGALLGIAWALLALRGLHR